MKPNYDLARKIRKTLTPPEYLLWVRLKARNPGKPVFRRQEAIGPYIADFYCSQAKLVIEVDGGLHGEEDNFQRDKVRDDWLKANGLDVYRISAAAVFVDADSVADGVILLAIERITARQGPHHHISPA
ncbi:endonuclease domain-containing protein [Asticcacaulis sp. 201]|uniref:endonuclease domain-containing protein n=1 Tax=Asticcacaulis sp. 201 TaxID=3028787 RepID=UPI002916CF0A|nr:endonuclease domain-containing protein [Asticcacaulis sp. 201]MDV6332501.1 endonuclease domain-containing protein [Asticcacaulis sp. 201]